MEFVRVKYANNKLINADIKEHRDIIHDYVDKKGYEYVGFIPVLFGPSGKMLELDLVFKKPTGLTKESAKEPAKELAKESDKPASANNQSKSST